MVIKAGSLQTELQETVKRKLDSARSPLNGDQNGICDGSYSPTTKRLRKDGSSSGGPGVMDSLTGLPNNSVPPISPLHQMDIKPLLNVNNPNVNNNSANNNNTANGNHVGPGRPGDLKLNGDLADIKLNGSLDLEDGFSLLKDLKQEPLDDGGGIESSDTSLSNQNKLFSDINLNDQEWQELIDELANTVPEDDMHDLFNEDFEEKKEAEFTRPANQTPVPQDPPPATTAHPASNQSQGATQVPMGSPQVRPASSGPQFATAANGTPPQQPLQQSPQVAMASGSPLPNCVARSPQTPTQAQTQAGPRPGNGFLMNPGQGVGQAGAGPNGPGAPPGGQGPVTSDLSHAEQLKAMAAQQRAKLLQQKQQQQQQQANWSPVGAPTSPYGSGHFSQQDKPNSPMMYPAQAFNPGPQGPLVAGMTPNNGPKAGPMNNYLPQNSHNHMGMMNQQQQQTNNMAAQQNALSKQQQQTAAMLSYNNTKPLSHFSAMGVDHMGQRMTPPMGSQVKNPMMPPYMQQGGGGVQGAGPGQTQGPIPGQTAHLSEEQKRMLVMKQKVLNQSMPYSAMQPHAQEQGVVGLSRQPGVGPPPHPGGGVASGVVPNQGAGAPPGYLGNQQQAAMMKQMMVLEEKRAQIHMMEQQQQQQLLREQRQQQHQQQQQHILAEQLQHQQHLPRQMVQGQRNPYPQVSHYPGTPQEMAARNQALQNIRSARLLQQNHQNHQLVQMNQGVPGSSVGPQPDMGLPYGGQGPGQQSLYGLNPSMSQIMQQQSQSIQTSMALPPGHNTATQIQRQAGGGPGVAGNGGGYGGPQGMMMMSQQPLKGPPSAKAQRLQSMLGGGGGTGGPQGPMGGWPPQQGQTLQGMGGVPSGVGGPGRTTGDMVGFGPAQGGYGSMQPGGPGQQPPRLGKQHFPGHPQGHPQALGQPMDPRAMNPAAGMAGPMMAGPHMAGPGQPRTNQPRPMVMPGQGVMGQGVPGMGAFGQGPGGQAMGVGPGGTGGGGYVGQGVGGQPQAYQRTSSQDLSSYGYGQGAASGGGFGLADGTGADLDSSDGWMEEFFPNQ
ncbi:hypothetical protein UPYG_G00047470 [Umbra pygmaea]|uniref:Mastermind-like protein 3 n=1 Tax=Umbra pygmaea TaxID=75934 RepID=A0ABD0XR83_UMBPY